MQTASTAMGVATSAATAAIPIAKATAVAMLQRHDFAAEQFVGQAKSLILKYATYCNKYVVATRTSKCVQQQVSSAGCCTLSQNCSVVRASGAVVYASEHSKQSILHP